MVSTSNSSAAIIACLFSSITGVVNAPEYRGPARTALP